MLDLVYFEKDMLYEEQNRALQSLEYSYTYIQSIDAAHWLVKDDDILGGSLRSLLQPGKRKLPSEANLPFFISL